VAADPKEDIGHLRDAVKLDPEFAPAWLALGRTYFADEDYDDAATTLGHLPADDPNALEADFYRGLAYFYTGNYREAEDAFAFVSTAPAAAGGGQQSGRGREPPRQRQRGAF